MAPIAVEPGGPLDSRHVTAPSLTLRSSVGIQMTPSDGEKERLEMLDAELQMDWARAMDNPQQYEKISVLLIYWAASIDELKCKEEVHRLSNSFKERFNYPVNFLEIEASSTPSHQVMTELYQFIKVNDGKKNLLVVYYAGHGVRGFSEESNSEDVLFVAKNDRDPSVQGVEENLQVHWTRIEDALKSASAHKLCIFDCCFSGNIARKAYTILDRSNFEVLSANYYEGLTRGPGPHSFTNALIWALEQLLNEYGEKGFTTTHLRRKIMEEPGFPPEHHPEIKEINMHARNRIVLHPVDRNDGSSYRRNSSVSSCATEDWSASWYCLNLRFILDIQPDKPKIEELAQCFRRILSNKDVPGLRRIGWDGLTKLNTAHHHALILLKDNLRRSNIIKKDVVDKWKGSTMKNRERYQDRARDTQEDTGLAGIELVTGRTKIELSENRLDSFDECDGIETLPLQAFECTSVTDRMAKRGWSLASAYTKALCCGVLLGIALTTATFSYRARLPTKIQLSGTCFE